jgi:hypothetical protein
VIELAEAALTSSLEGSLEVRRTDRGMQPLRLSDEAMDHTHHALRTPFVAEATNGIRVRFETTATTLALDFSLVLSERTAFALNAGRMTPPTFDLRLDDTLHDRRAVSHHEEPQSIRFSGLPGTSVIAELWLPHNVGIVIHHLRSDAPFTAAPDPRPRWLIHGSSITHDALAPGPSDTWPAQLARDAGWHVTNLGFRGECHLDPFVARSIAAAHADLITFELGINVHNQHSMRERSFEPAVHGFLQSVRDGHRRAPLVVVSPLFGAERENETHSISLDGETLSGDLTLSRIRQAIRTAVETRQRYGDMAITYQDGLSLLGANDAARFFDGLHPDAEGTQILRSRLAAYLTLS